MKKPRWTTEEDTQLRKLYPANAQTLIEAFPNRSLGTIRVRAHSLGITRKYTKKAVPITTSDVVCTNL